MNAKFGPGGNAQLFYDQGFKKTQQAPKWLNDLGLDVYEYEGGNGITASTATLEAIGEEAKKYGIAMSLHTPYFISLSSEDEGIRIKSVQYILKSAEAAEALGARVMVVHTGSCAKISRERAMKFARKTIEYAVFALDNHDYKVKIGLETMGKLNQLGTLDEVIELCKVDKRLEPVVDFGHMNAREQGRFFNADDYKYVFDRISKGLDAEYAMKLHCHFSKIEFTKMGEKKHLTFEDSTYGPEFEPLAEAIVSLGVTPTIICESDGTMTEDALEMKRLYQKALKSDIKQC
ncbi:MAG: hypothetical protein A2Y17_07800 [Clostridiales bacterium GWF2_38_85]|nr:MAG: hypothetical protein A2Y17_07800 [Clostridiales bacterium GWF2_38_85]HBL84221.1 endonuclease IV [Clostridiales bacterium]